jgi:DNA-binding response OmpR family regulator
MSDHPDVAGRILLIEKNPDVIVPLTQYFGQTDHTELVVSQDANDGLHQAARFRPDLILLAATLGQVDGLEVYRRLRRIPLTAHIPIMFLADFRDAKRQNQLLADGADDVIIQPFDLDILALRIRNAIQRSRREGLTESRTGLPTGALIAEKIAAFKQGGDWIRLELTLADFDAFRARYNFISGNDVLRFAAGAICEVVDELTGGQGFIGHRDDGHFVVMASQAQADPLKAELTTRLDDGLTQFYSFMEREQGYVEVEDDQGGIAQRPLMHLIIESESSSG